MTTHPLPLRVWIAKALRVWIAKALRDEATAKDRIAR
jgi:hypothetical protein